MYSPVKQPRKPIYVFFCQKVRKSENFSNTSTGRETLLDLSNKLQDGLLKVITDLSVMQYHSNGCYKPQALQAQRELKNRKRKEHITENNEAEISVLVEQDRRSKRQISNDNRSKECTICGNKTFTKDSKLYRL